MFTYREMEKGSGYSFIFNWKCPCLPNGMASVISVYNNGLNRQRPDMQCMTATVLTRPWCILSLPGCTTRDMCYISNKEPTCTISILTTIQLDVHTQIKLYIALKHGTNVNGALYETSRASYYTIEVYLTSLLRPNFIVTGTIDSTEHILEHVLRLYKSPSARILQVRTVNTSFGPRLASSLGYG